MGEQRVLVNSGTSLYGVSSERHRQRKTSCHNTVEVDGFDSSEIWSGFRVARRAYSSLESAQSDSNSVSISASHNGYQRLSGRVTHTRYIDVTNSDVKIIGTRHGEKLYESLLSREEMAKAQSTERYYRVPMDARDLNYDKFVDKGEERISHSNDYNSHNTTRLDIKNMKKLLMKISFMKDVINGDFKNLYKLQI